MGAFCRALAVAGLLACLSASSALSTSTHATTRVLTYRSPQALKTLLARTGFKVKRNLPALHAVARVDQVPDSVLRAAAKIKIAVIDTGVDLRQPDIAAKNPQVYSVIHPKNRPNVRDYYGHGTFVASLAAGSVTNGEGIAGFGGDAPLLCVQVAHPDGSISDVDEAAGIVYAVKRGAKIINLSLGGLEPSALETRAVRYAQRHGVLNVAAAGNEFRDGNPIEYPAALLQPKGSDGRGGSGLSVGASTQKGE